jgi:hypothetical protein
MVCEVALLSLGDWLDPMDVIRRLKVFAFCLIWKYFILWKLTVQALKDKHCWFGQILPCSLLTFVSIHLTIHLLNVPLSHLMSNSNPLKLQDLLHWKFSAWFFCFKPVQYTFDSTGRFYSFCRDRWLWVDRKYRIDKLPQAPEEFYVPH